MFSKPVGCTVKFLSFLLENLLCIANELPCILMFSKPVGCTVKFLSFLLENLLADLPMLLDAVGVETAPTLLALHQWSRRSIWRLLRKAKGSASITTETGGSICKCTCSAAVPKTAEAARIWFGLFRWPILLSWASLLSTSRNGVAPPWKRWLLRRLLLPALLAGRAGAHRCCAR